DGLGPCAATASFLLYALDREILVLHHGSLAIEKRFSLHRQPVRWIQVDNVSDSAGRLAVSYDAGNTAIVWDIWTGAELSRFSSYDRLRAASFMRNGNLAFGNDQGNIILFEHASAEHIAVRTIYDPIAALAPAADCRTFAIGYLNGSILVATVQPFAIVHTLNLNRPPGRIAGLAWHGSSSRQKTEMLATHTADGDLRVWSLPKAPSSDPPTVIRMLQLGDASGARGDCWMNWSKNGRIVQHVAGHTRAWDVRTKKVTWVTLQTPEGLSAMANYGPSSMLFAIRGRDGLVQQYDVNDPALVKSV
ncbi:WD40 repeat-like protein, partial [Piedraia hortae CBS 480.64]